MKRPCKPCMVISYTATAPCKPCTVISYTMKAPRKSRRECFGVCGSSRKDISQKESAPHSYIITFIKSLRIGRPHILKPPVRGGKPPLLEEASGRCRKRMNSHVWAIYPRCIRPFVIHPKNYFCGDFFTYKKI